MYFLSSKHCKFTPKCLPYPMAKLVSMMYKDLQECRMIYKLVANRIVVVDNSAIIFRICMNFAILLLQLGYPLIPQNKTKNDQNQKQRLSKSIHQPYSLILYSFSVSVTFLKEKKHFLDGQNSRKFQETHFQSSES